MWPCAARAAVQRARAGSTPSRSQHGRDRGRGRRAQRDQAAAGPDRRSAGRRPTARRAARPSAARGSSIALSSALAACSVARSASSNSTTRQRPPTGDGGRLEHQVPGLPARRTTARPGGPAAGRRACRPRPGGRTGTRRSRCRSHSSAAANARAATDRPEPGGPVNSQACVMPAPAAPDRSLAARTARRAGRRPPPGRSAAPNTARASRARLGHRGLSGRSVIRAPPGRSR